MSSSAAASAYWRVAGECSLLQTLPPEYGRLLSRQTTRRLPFGFLDHFMDIRDCAASYLVFATSAEAPSSCPCGISCTGVAVGLSHAWLATLTKVILVRLLVCHCEWRLRQSIVPVSDGWRHESPSWMR